MSTSIVDLDGVDIREAPVLMTDCSLPVMDWRSGCMADDVLANFPMGIACWNDGTTAPGIVDSTINIDTTGITDPDCESATVQVSMASCELTAPNMKDLSLQTNLLKFKEWKAKFCNPRRIAPGEFCVFDQSGNLNVGDPLVVDFMMLALKGVEAGMSQLIEHSVLVGDYSNPFQVDGLYTQIDNGWSVKSEDSTCADCINTGVTIDWAALTDAEGCASPDDCIGAGKTITLCGEECPLPEGMKFTEFLEDIWFPYTARESRRFGGVDAYELHVAPGKGKCLISEAACMQPCSTCGSVVCVQHEDSGIRERFADAHRSGTVEMYPSGLRIPVLETKHMDDDCIRIGPRSIGGKNTYSLMFAPLSEMMPELPDTQYGMPEGSDPQIEINLDGSMTSGFDAQTLLWTLQQQSLRCFTAEMMTCYGVLACWRHLWLKVENMCCCGCVKSCDSNVVVDGVALGATE